MFDKTLERFSLEREIHTAHEKALAVGLKMAQEEYGGDLETALANSDFVARVQNTVKTERGKYQRLTTF